MKTTIHWYVVMDDVGTKRAIIVDDPSTSTNMRGHHNGLMVYFDAEAYHLSTWCDQYGFKFEYGDMEIELPVEK